MPSAQNDNSQTNILDALLSKKLLTPAQVEDVKLEQVNTGKSYKEIIFKKNLVTVEDYVQTESIVRDIPSVNLGETAISPQALSLISQAVADRYNLLPFSYDKATNTLSVAMGNPMDMEAIEFVSKKSGARIVPYVAPVEQIKSSVVSAYGQGLSTEVNAALKEATGTGGVSNKPMELVNFGSVIREAPISKIVSTVLEFAIKARASDVHIEPEEDKTRVRYRIDGILHEKLILPRSVHEALVSRIKILSEMKIDEKRIPQDGRFSFKTGDQEVDLRVSSLPTVHGEKIVMRLLKKSGGVPDLPDLGLRGVALKNLEDAILRPHGIITVVGPTGSGKTTTLYAVLSRINTPRVNIMTLEDPVEYQIAGVNQVQINPVAGLTFSSGLRSFLRQDPNIIMVGEIRDRETTELAIQASLTGHLVFSTLHTNNASQAIPRLTDLGAEPFLLASSMTCVVAQRICRRVCPDCKEEYKPLPEVVIDVKNILGKLIDEKKEVTFTRGKKCTTCNNTGYLGRIGVFEVLPFTEKIARLILERSSAGEIEKVAKEEGMITMKQDGYLKALEGLTTLEEVLRVAQE